MITKKGGCILINKKDKTIAIIYRPQYNDYSFPKGHLEGDETIREGAIRETIEETARDIELIYEEPISVEKYTTPRGEDVECYFYLAEDKGEYQGEIAEKDREICKWIKFEEVEGILSYDNPVKMWNEIKDKVAEAF